MSRTISSSPFVTNRPITAPVIDRLPDPQNAGLDRIETLLDRMRDGDREAAAEFMDEYGQRVRRRIRGKLGTSMRRLFDSLDILSTLGRRLDLYVMSGRVRAASEAQLWSLVFQMADRALIDKARVFRRLQHTESEDSNFAQEMTSRLRKAETVHAAGVEDEIDRFIRAIQDPTDRRILSLWLAGETHHSIAEHVEMTPANVRKRWEGIKIRLRERLAAE